MSSLLRRGIPSALLVLAGLLPASADATGWVTAPALSRPDRAATTPLVGLTPSGERIVAWVQHLRVGSVSAPDGLIVRTAPAAADFGPPQAFGGNVQNPSLSTGTDGTVAIVWVAFTQLHIARRAPGEARFTEAAPLELGADRSTPAVALLGGDVYVALGTRDRKANVDKSAIRVVRLASAATSIEAVPGTGPAGVLDAASYNANTEPDHVVDVPRIAAGAGTIHVAWQDRRDSTGAGMNGLTAVRRATRPAAGGVFTAPIPVDSIMSQSFRAPDASPSIAAAAGRVDLAWSRGPQSQVAAQEISAGDPVQPIATAATPFGVRVGLDPTGARLLSWEQFSTNDAVFAAFGTIAAPGEPAGPARRLTPPNVNQTLDDFVVGPDGSAVALTNRRVTVSSRSADARVQASFRAPGGTFGELEDVSGRQDRTNEGAFDRAAGAIGADGTTVVAWTADDAGNNRVHVSERDDAPPTIGALTVPATATAETPVAMAAGVTDALSPVVVTWDLGDGSRRQGGSTTHSYGAPGDYTVTLTARDGAGNIATQTRTIAVSPVPTAAAAPPEPVETPPLAPDRSPPVVSDLKSANRRFRVGPRATTPIAARSKTPAGTVFNLRLDERATLVFRFSGTVAGRRSGKRCLAGRKAGRRCNATVRPGTLIRTVREPGAVAVPFSGRVDRTPLAPGTYVASVTAIDAASNRSRPTTVRFTVVSR